MDDLEQVLVDLGRRLDLAQIVATPEGSWRVAVDPDDWFEIAFDSERAVITISQELARPAPAAAAALHALALQYNFLWDQTGGARLSLDGPDGALVLSLDLAVTLGTADDLEPVIANFRAVAGAWTELIETPPAGLDQVSPATLPEGWLRA